MGPARASIKRGQGLCNGRTATVFEIRTSPPARVAPRRAREVGALGVVGLVPTVLDAASMRGLRSSAIDRD